MKAPIVVTTGEPAGIGPELALMLAAADATDWVAIGDPVLLRERAEALALDIEVAVTAPGQPHPGPRVGRLAVWPVDMKARCIPGVLDPANADYVLATLDLAVTQCLAGNAAAMVTAPLHKGVICDGGHDGFTGHTEYLRDACGVEEVVMMLATDHALHGRVEAASDTLPTPLRVALATTHLPLREVADALSQASLERVLRILAQDLTRYFAVKAPRIAICGLNPHAGEGGHLGREEIEVITPTLERLRAEGFCLDGPLPADTLFTPRHLAGVDAVLAMYHDQGLPVLKYSGFGQAANITLGLPLARTSVDHGTALDLAGTGQASPQSLAVAISLAEQMGALAQAG
ncbi:MULTISPECIES: 4-hydroxythreonine-4-phosphate dehydrogenase PdxA [unclassified Halomonas]|uniref:4-hydroxythreonine-4-phosphate dehydrogenase PdxA n=1 Tax=unclassified Halomonas TaxID=2609666 RepID=UPI001C947625|nr:MULTISPECIES: 4-hydroxythreonine-4-phosphate dehydrogenase PdxA [unclassified Halomonas]MBY5924590.1 4-hydroxythreonine-4-phosphate dehydrogenase PdxA [Halomonas sp. DP4Y7-2]MBY6231632.1 4-hydroxythreonine-4-phosphate dehydrogenase PdxA [Halomonas sp. DP4Y7-1]